MFDSHAQLYITTGASVMLLPFGRHIMVSIDLLPTHILGKKEDVSHGRAEVIKQQVVSVVK